MQPCLDKARTDHEFRCAANEAGQRLDVVLATRFPEVSRARLQRLIAQRHVTVNQRSATQKRLLAAGDHVRLRLPVSPPPATRPEAENIPIPILYEDRDLIVIDKPAGLVVHPAPGHDRGTLVNALLHRYQDLADVGGEGRPGIVHRLDKDTSGVMLVARHHAAYLALGHQFRQRTVRKEYLALVRGVPVPAAGRIDAALARHPRDRQRFAVVRQGGRAALTTFRVIEALPDASLLRVCIATGRTHQIRVHMAWRGHPVLGDVRYGHRSQRRRESQVPRQMLHAQRIDFTHPVTGAAMDVQSPMPADMGDVLQRLRNSPSNCHS